MFFDKTVFWCFWGPCWLPFTKRNIQDLEICNSTHSSSLALQIFWADKFLGQISFRPKNFPAKNIFSRIFFSAEKNFGRTTIRLKENSPEKNSAEHFFRPIFFGRKPFQPKNCLSKKFSGPICFSVEDKFGSSPVHKTTCPGPRDLQLDKLQLLGAPKEQSRPSPEYYCSGNTK